MTIRLSLVLLLLSAPFAGAQPPKTKDVIPHAQSKPPGSPKSPAEALKTFTVPPGFSVELVAAEPDLVNPVAMFIDEKGRFWVTESVEYPKKQPGPGKDRVKVIEIGEDGKAKKITTVIEGLNIPSGIAVGHGGVWLANAPDILYYPLEDFDALKLGKPQVVVTGFGRTDTHELPNSLTWGPDGWLFGLNGVFNPSHVKQEGKEWKFTCALFRIHPRTKQFEIFCEGTSNPWGLAFNDNGDAFVSACVIDHLWHLTQTGYYQRQGGAYPPFASKIGSIVKHKHQKAAYCGLCWYDADAYPEEYRKKLYMGNIHGNCINSDELTKDGSTYLAKPRPDFLSSSDAWFMPIAQKVGPDGCMYILDWYDRYHCYQDANRDPKGIDRLYGRLYRVRYKETPRAMGFDLKWATEAKLVERLGNLKAEVRDKARKERATNFAELVKALDDRNVFKRETAQRLLVEMMMELTKSEFGRLEWRLGQFDRKLAAAVFNGEASREGRLHAFWAHISCELEREILRPETGYDEAFVRKTLSHADPIFRAWAIRQLASGKFPVNTQWITERAGDPSPEVRLQVAVAAHKIRPGFGSPLATLQAVLKNSGDDKLIPAIVWQNVHPALDHPRAMDWLTHADKLDPAKAPAVFDLMPKIAERILSEKKQEPRVLEMLLRMLDKTPDRRDICVAVLAKLNGMAQSGELAGDRLNAVEDRLLPVVKQMQENASPALALEAKLLGAALKDEGSVNAVREMVADAGSPEALRLKGLETLIAAGDAVALERIKAEFAKVKRTSLLFRGNLLAALGKLDDPNIAGFVLGRYAELEPELQTRAIELLTQRPAWSLQLLEQIKDKKVPATAVSLNQVRKMLAGKSDEVKELVGEIWGTIRDGRNAEREKVVAEMRELIRKTPGDAIKGLAVFKKTCAVCHKLHGDGTDVGPDLTGNGRADFEQLLSNVFDPSLVIGLGYRQTTVVTTRGQSLNGLLVEDNPQRVVLKTQGGKVETIARADVEQVTTIAISFMPEGVERQLTPQEIADLFALLTLDRPPNDPAAKKIPGAK